MNISVSDAEVTVQGTEERRRPLDEALVDVLTQDRLRPHEAASLAGKLQFYSQAARRSFARSSTSTTYSWRVQAETTTTGGSTASCDTASGCSGGLCDTPRRRPSLCRRLTQCSTRDAFFNLFETNWKPADEDIPNWGRTPPETLRHGWGFVVTVRGTTFFAHGSVPYWLVREFWTRRAYIYIYEH